MFYPEIYDIGKKYWFQTEAIKRLSYQRTKLDDWNVLEDEATLVIKYKWYWKAYYIKDLKIQDPAKCKQILNDFLLWKYENTLQVKVIKKMFYWIYTKLPVSKNLKIKIWFNL